MNLKLIVQIYNNSCKKLKFPNVVSNSLDSFLNEFTKKYPFLLALISLIPLTNSVKF